MRKNVKCFALLFVWMAVTKIFYIHAHPSVFAKPSDVSDSELLKNGVQEEWESMTARYRLPQFVRPLGYRLEITTRIGVPGKHKSNEFQGRVEIDIIVETKTNKIILHSENLKISKFEIKKIHREDKLERIIMDVESERDFVVFKRTDGEFEAETYTIALDYFGSYSRGSFGFLKTSYWNDAGLSVWYAVTQFQPTGARRAFPCFDEPGFKAKFNISITHYQNFTANSNTIKMSTSEPDVDGMVTTKFEESPKMPIYLVAFLVSDFESISNDERDFRILARPNATINAPFALHMGKLIMTELNNYIGTSYFLYLKKMDQVALPNGLDTKAMENWGLVTYQETELLIDKRSEAFPILKQIAAELISHEFSHQWFGNLVSPKWWKYLWLSEGLAEFFSHYIIERIEPRWRSMENFVVREILCESLVRDSAQGKALNYEVETPAEIRSVFNGITYQKGAAMIRMMQHFLTKGVFHKGIQNYVNKKKEASVDSDDLFQLIDEVRQSDEISTTATRPDNLTIIMNTWVNQAGYPLITVTRDYSNNTVRLEQECFDASMRNCKTIWHVPVNYATPKNMDFNDTSVQVWLINASTEMSINAESEDWIMLNKQATGYYRINYDERNWLLITEYLKSSRESLESIHILNRAQLLNDAFTLVKSDRLSLSILLKFTTVLKNETDHLVWIPALAAIKWLKPKLISTEFFPVFKRYFEKIEKTVDAQSVGIDLNEIFEPDSREIYFNHRDCYDDPDLWNLLHRVANRTTLSFHISAMTLCCDHSDINDGEFHEILKGIPEEYLGFTKYSKRKTLCFRNSQLIRYYLNLKVGNNSRVETVDDSFLSEFSNEPEIIFVIRRFKKIIGHISNAETTLVQSIANGVRTEAQLKKLKEMEELNEGQKSEWLSRALDSAEKKIQWLKQNKPFLDEWTRELGDILAHET